MAIYDTIEKIISSRLPSEQEKLMNEICKLALADLPQLPCDKQVIKEYKDRYKELFEAYNSLKFYERYITQYKAIGMFAVEYKNICKHIDHNINTIPSESTIQDPLLENKQYFDECFKYPLTEQQRKAIVAPEQNVIVIASAGSGKTATIAAKADYLVNRCNVSPSKILALSFTGEAAGEMDKRMKDGHVFGVTCSTFHEHARKIIGIGQVDIPDSLIYRLFSDKCEKDKDYRSLFIDYLTQWENTFQYDFLINSSRINYRSPYALLAPYKDMDGKNVILKSKQELDMFTLLTEWGLKVRYEELYNGLTDNRKYRPDFTIHYIDNVTGKPRTLYIEHFGIDANGNVPKWWAEGRPYTYDQINRMYNNTISRKRACHRANGTNLLETTSADFNDMEGLKKRLRIELQQYHITLRDLSVEERTDLLVHAIDKEQKRVARLVEAFITQLKAIDEKLDSNFYTKHKCTHRDRKVIEQIIQPIYSLYQSELEKEHQLDYSDQLYNAIKIMHNDPNKREQYDYILVDEYQDMSIDKFAYLKALCSPTTHLFCVGDDWQSIYRFSGSDLNLFTDFSKRFNHAAEYRLEETFRFGEPLLSKSSSFILQNPKQAKKILNAGPNDTTISTCPYWKNKQYQEIEQLIKNIPQDESILILARNWFELESLLNITLQERASYINATIANHKVTAKTIHSAKGTEAHHVFVIGCNDDKFGIPSQVEEDPVMKYVLTTSDKYPYAEERRVFYVAVTRAIKAVYLMYDAKKPSAFIKEIDKALQDDKDECPCCHNGKIRYIGIDKKNKSTLSLKFACTNKYCLNHQDENSSNSYVSADFYGDSIRLDLSHFKHRTHLTDDDILSAQFRKDEQCMFLDKQKVRLFISPDIKETGQELIENLLKHQYYIVEYKKCAIKCYVIQNKDTEIIQYPSMKT